MAGDKRSKKDAQLTKSDHKEPITSLAIARGGLKTSAQLTALNCAVISDLLESRMTSSVANAIGSQCARILKTKEMEFRYGQPRQGNGGTAASKTFLLTESVTNS